MSHLILAMISTTQENK
ncbi:TPA: hypothetical protein ACJI8J_004098 [Kluyvera georgiana]|nr:MULTISPECIES: hypothetical protein [Kluyvera]MDA8490384.1 hypothetical protein [Kluyvera sp. Awk 3]MDA8495495.1 hypothetical protein [Kluyvera georgiana]UAK22575.1 hypothetical protein K7B04_02240 [Kluyvera sp. CRP]